MSKKNTNVTIKQVYDLRWASILVILVFNKGYDYEKQYKQYENFCKRKFLENQFRIAYIRYRIMSYVQRNFFTGSNKTERDFRRRK